MIDDNTTKKRCQAMIDAGISDPESAEGIEFCAGTRDGSVASSCPYSYCVAVEYEKPAATLRKENRSAFAKDLKAHGVSVKDIALIIGVSVRGVERYLRLKEER